MSTIWNTGISWDYYAKCYDSLNFLLPYQELQRSVSQRILSFGGTRVLDAACGTGNLEEMLRKEEARRGPTILEIQAIDSSREMLARAHEKHSRDRGIIFQCCDLNKVLPFGDKVFHQIASINTLYAVQTPERTVAEFYRVLQDDGIINIVTPKAGYENGLILREHCRSTKPASYWSDAHQSREREEMLLREAINDQEVLRDMLTVARINRMISVNKSFHFFTEANLVLLLQRCGFTILHTSYTYAEQGLFVTAQKRRGSSC